MFFVRMRINNLSVEKLYTHMGGKIPLRKLNHSATYGKQNEFPNANL